MKLLRRISRSGSSFVVSIPRPFLHHLDWKPHQQLVVELLDDGTIWLRVPSARDLVESAGSRLHGDTTAPGALCR